MAMLQVRNEQGGVKIIQHHHAMRQSSGDIASLWSFSTGKAELGRMPGHYWPARRARVRQVGCQGSRDMEHDPKMPSALAVAQALSSVLTAKLANLAAERIDLSRDEAALCLGVIDGIVENIESKAETGI